MDSKTKNTLTPEQETLLIILYARIQPENPLFFDRLAQKILNQIDYDFTKSKVPYKTIILVCQRIKKLGAVTREFPGRKPLWDSVAFGLPAGLPFLAVSQWSG